MSEPLRFQRDLKSILRLMRGAADHVVISRLGWALVLTVASGMLGGLAPLALKQLIDGVSQPSPSPAAAGVAVAPWLPMLMIYAVLLAGARLLAEVRLWPASQGEQRLVSHMTGHAFKRLLHLPLQRQLEQPPGAAVQTVDQAMVGIQILLAHLIGSVVPTMVELGTAAWVLLQLGQPWVVVTLFITALAYGSLHAVLALRLLRHADAVAEAARGVRTALTEGLSHPEAVQALEVHAPLQRRLDGATRQLQHRWRTLAAQRAALGLCTSASLLMALATVLMLALHSLRTGRPKVELVLSDEERSQLQSFARSRSLPAALSNRARIVLASAGGELNSAIADRLKLSDASPGFMTTFVPASRAPSTMNAWPS